MAVVIVFWCFCSIVIAPIVGRAIRGRVSDDAIDSLPHGLPGNLAPGNLVVSGAIPEQGGFDLPAASTLNRNSRALD
jgi:hypothetical protein